MNFTTPGKYTALTPEIYNYTIRHQSHTHDPLLNALRQETKAFGEISRMLISEEQGSFFTLLVAALGVRSAIEIGTFTGGSAICIARGLSEKGRLICCDINEVWTAIAKKYWAEAGVDHKIELRLGPAAETLQKFPSHEIFDFAFIDADKTGYDTYFELLFPRLKPNGIMIFDNMLWGGKLENGQTSNADGQAIHHLNEKLSTDSRIESVLLPIADGLMMCRKK